MKVWSTLVLVSALCTWLPMATGVEKECGINSKRKKKKSTIEDMLAKEESQKREVIENIQQAINEHQEYERSSPERAKRERKMLTSFKFDEMRCVLPKDPSPNCSDFDAVKLKEDKSILVMHTNGRLGNQMSTYATLWAYGQVLGVRTFIYREQFDYLSKYFANIDLPVIEDLYCDPCELPWKDFRPGGRMKRHGQAYVSMSYFQNPSLYTRYMTELKRTFTIREKYISKAELVVAAAVASKAKTRATVLVGVHIRRTDFPYPRGTLKDGITPTQKYISKAFQHFRSKFPDLLLLVVSDDMEWAEKNLQGDDLVLVGSQGRESDEDSVGVDMAILSRCHHLIMTYGTFGMWAGLLRDADGGETVMAEHEPAGLLEPKLIKAAGLPGWTLISWED